MVTGPHWRTNLTDVQTYLRKLTSVTAELIEEADDPQQAMRDLAEAATESGLILDEAIPRYETPAMFAADLLENNPIAPDLIRAKLAFEGMNPDPSKYEVVDEIVSELLPDPR